MKVTTESFINGSSSSRPIHVYLSFKGDDETCRFTDMLWAALESNDLNTFWDDKYLEPGDSTILPRHFLKAIKQSNISIVVLSKSYASSTWCLEELSEIIARIHEPRYTAFSMFYDVHPYELQNRSNSFEKAFAEYEQRCTANLRKVHSWRSAIKQVANLSGWHVPSEPEPEVIDDIIKEVKKKMRDLVYADVDLVGMQSRVREVEDLMDLGSNDEIRVVGICGMGGIGKSTLARVLHDRISCHFDYSYFVLNALEFYETTGLRHYMRTLIVFDCDEIFNIRRSLDFAIRGNQLGGGSRIVITTRDEGVLRVFENHDIYRVKLMTNNEALQLFCRKAFKCDFPVRGFEKQIDSILKYASGLPLAIVVLSQLLYNRTASEWSSGLDEFRNFANSMIMKVLKKSFDELDKDCKETFLDIACFFIGKDNKFVEGVLHSSRPFSSNRRRPVKYDKQLLIEKSLMFITDQKIQMHALVQEMGREIVGQTNPCCPGLWSRLWDFHDIYEVMKSDTGSLKVEAIVLDLEDSQRKTLRVEALSRMHNLRMLIFRNVKFFGVLKSLSWKLQYISWHQYPFTSLPSSFTPNNLRELILPDSYITSIWDEKKFSNSRKVFSWLRNMNLSGSKDLMKMPYFKGFLPSLERLELEGCTKLSQLDPSIASLSKLKFLNLRNCSNIVSVPNDLFSLASLEMLNLACCSKLAYCLKFCPFDEELGERESIQQSFPCKRQKLCKQKSI